jgi:prolyl-tRNA editing enzyme YbaK/EbsC (Cys-tRNA(Pro) deacylase)
MVRRGYVRGTAVSKSVERVRAALQAAGLETEVVRMPDSTRTAAEAAAAAGCTLDQIVKSIVFRTASGGVVLFLTAGGNRVDADKAARVAGEALGRADADTVRAATGFAIGGVAPVGHVTPVPVFWDRRLDDFAEVWAAAGTPNHIFRATPAALRAAAGAIPADFT